MKIDQLPIELLNWIFSEHQIWFGWVFSFTHVAKESHIHSTEWLSYFPLCLLIFSFVASPLALFWANFNISNRNIDFLSHKFVALFLENECLICSLAFRARKICEWQTTWLWNCLKIIARYFWITLYRQHDIDCRKKTESTVCQSALNIISNTTYMPGLNSRERSNNNKQKNVQNLNKKAFQYSLYLLSINSFSYRLSDPKMSPYDGARVPFRPYSARFCQSHWVCFLLSSICKLFLLVVFSFRFCFVLWFQKLGAFVEMMNSVSSRSFP